MNERLLAAVGRIVRDVLRTALREAGRSPKAPGAPVPRGAPGTVGERERGTAASEKAAGYPGDYRGMPVVEYAPVRGSRPDPGEVVWTWVPYEEDHSRGKDRPVLLVGRDGAWLLGLQLTSIDHDRDADQEARAGRFWVEIGAGPWDSRGRVSEVRVNRVLRIDPDAVRRVSVSLPRPLFDDVVDGMRRHLG